MTDTLAKARRVDDPSGLTMWHGEHVASLRSVSCALRVQAVTDKPGLQLYVKPTVTEDCIQVDLVDADGVIYGWGTQNLPKHAPDPEADQLAAERTEAIEVAREAMSSGDAGTVVDALIAHGWGKTPPVPEPDDWDDWDDQL